MAQRVPEGKSGREEWRHMPLPEATGQEDHWLSSEQPLSLQPQMAEETHRRGDLRRNNVSERMQV